MSRIIIYPYKMGSRSASVLAEALRATGKRCFKVHPDRNYRPRDSDLIINWGNSVVPNWLGDIRINLATERLVNFLNEAHLVTNASNKLRAFELMQDAGVQIPEFHTDPNWVNDVWMGRDAWVVVARTLLQGHSGAGIEIYNPAAMSRNEDGVNYDDFNFHAPLYVKYIKKSEEYRVHVFNGQVIDIQQKRKRREMPSEDVDYKVRSHANGWVFTRENVNPNDQVREQSILAVNALGLDFGAVDVIWNEHYQSAYVLEVNTAAGLEGSTIDSYVTAINSIYDSRR